MEQQANEVRESPGCLGIALMLVLTTVILVSCMANYKRHYKQQKREIQKENKIS